MFLFFLLVRRSLEVKDSEDAKNNVNSDKKNYGSKAGMMFFVPFTQELTATFQDTIQTALTAGLAPTAMEPSPYHWLELIRNIVVIEILLIGHCDG